MAGARYEQMMNMVVGGRCWSSRAGRIQDALDYAAQAREFGEAVGDARLRAWRAMEGEPYFYKGLWVEVARVAEENLPVAFEIGEWNALLFGSAWLGIAYVKLGRLDEARRVLERAVREGRARLGLAYPTSFVLIAVAQLHVALGEPVRGRRGGARVPRSVRAWRLPARAGRGASRPRRGAGATRESRGGGHRVPQEPSDPRGDPVASRGGPDAPRPRSPHRRRRCRGRPGQDRAGARDLRADGRHRLGRGSPASTLNARGRQPRLQRVITLE